ncbi:AraC family transcriptional regulator [Anaerosinus massiliensis]|uniref:AraC family transcriptional regulator n=1 Tax=Massilibacillus massiliensis TaxID=1806837 RepID=UPI000DA5EF15|nr:AraC family transcriptional regulator [Massilibacillus massiliensis]
MLQTIIVHRIVKQKKSKLDYIERHTHTFFHYIYGLSGTAKVVIDQTECIATAKSLIMIPPETPHEIYGIDEFLSFDIKFQCCEELSEKLKSIQGPFKHKVNDYIDFQIKEMFHEGIQSQSFYQDIINAKMTEVLLYILRASQETQEAITPTEYITTSIRYKNYPQIQTIMPAINYINEHINEPLRIKELAKLCNYTENYFSTYFKNCMGIAPIKYIHAKKIAMAKSLLISTDLKITQISEKLGFENIHYFSRIFKQIIGITPKAYLDRTKMKLDTSLNIVNSAYTPSGEYEIPLKRKPESSHAKL